MEIYQLFVTLLDGKTLTVNSKTPRISAAEIKRRISEATSIPADLQRLLTGIRQLDEDSVVSGDEERRHFPAVTLALRLRGGKGGFGSLLRGAGSKAWQKKTNNFDACRDMSGRRLRHVNAERRLEEWRAAEEERRLERKAEEFLKKTAKKGKKGAGDGEAEKYVAKYREESERCVSEVLDSVKAAVKRKKVAPVKGSASDAKRLKIWTGKQKLEESDSDDSDNEQEKEKSSVSESDGNRSESSKDAEGSSVSVTGSKQDGEPSESGSEEEKENVTVEGKESEGFPSQDFLPEVYNEVSEPLSLDEKVSLASEANVLQDEKMNHKDAVVENLVTSSCGDGNESTSLPSESHSLESEPRVDEEAGSSGEVLETETLLNFDYFNSAAELEALGMERLKSELQDRGLKCGGTLQERAKRLFLLKSTPLEKLPKKLLAKK